MTTITTAHAHIPNDQRQRRHDRANDRSHGGTAGERPHAPGPERPAMPGGGAIITCRTHDI